MTSTKVMENVETMSPAERVFYRINKEFPKWKRTVKTYLREKNKYPWWKKWCFLPVDVAIDFLLPLKRKGVNFNIEKITGLTATAAWRSKKKNYRFDPELLELLWKTPLPENTLPVDLLYRLPDPCLFIETPGKKFFDKEFLGFFVFLGLQENKAPQLRFYLVFEEGEGERSIILDLKKGGIKESLIKKRKELEKERDVKFANTGTPEDEQYIQIINSMVSLTLFLCSEDKEISTGEKQIIEVPGKDKKAKKRKFAAEKAKLVLVSYKAGEDLLSIRQAGGTEGKRRTHTRAPHWHSYWVGEKGTSDRRILLRWIHEVLVNPGG